MMLANSAVVSIVMAVFASRLDSRSIRQWGGREMRVLVFLGPKMQPLPAERNRAIAG
jgi:hypothetical protein